jgi:hypothetical protein
MICKLIPPSLLTKAPAHAWLRFERGERLINFLRMI